jgi:uncharacterized protein YeaO (DUF488 family)
MKDTIDLSSIMEKKRIITSDMVGIIKELKSINIPKRSDIIQRFYLQDLEKYKDFGAHIEEGMNSSKKQGNQVVQNKSNKEIIELLLGKLSDDKDANNLILKQIFSKIKTISNEDKKVLMMTLVDSKPEEIRKSLEDILKIFLDT